MKKVLIAALLMLMLPIAAYAAEDFMIEDNVLYKYNGHDMYVTIPSEAVMIGEKAFAGNKALKQVIIHGGVKEIGEKAFEECVNLETVKGMAQTVCDGAFMNCTGLKSVPQMSAAINIGENSFKGCTSLDGIAFNDRLESIGQNAFMNCTSLTNVTIPYTLGVLESGAFMNCVRLRSVTFENEKKSGTENVCERAFYGCKALENINFPSSLETIGEYAFYGCGLKKLVIEKCEDIKDYAFSECKNLYYIKLGDNVANVGQYAFANDKSVTDKLISSYTNVDSTAFYGCDGLIPKAPSRNQNQDLIKAFNIWNERISHTKY